MYTSDGTDGAISQVNPFPVPNAPRVMAAKLSIALISAITLSTARLILLVLVVALVVALVVLVASVICITS
jgi:hypothetical protein